MYIYICIYVCMHVCMHVCMYVCMYIYIYIYIYIIVYFTINFMFSRAVLQDSAQVMNYHLLLRWYTRIPGVDPWSLQIGIWTTLRVRCMKYASSCVFSGLFVGMCVCMCMSAISKDS